MSQWEIDEVPGFLLKRRRLKRSFHEKEGSLRAQNVKKRGGGGGAVVGNIPALSQYVSTPLPRGPYPANTN